MKQRFLLVEVFPRLLGAGILAYLIYSLMFKAQALTSIHAWMATMMLILAIVPMASRLKISNWFDFSAKLDALQKQQLETKSELGEVRAQVSNVIEIHATPVQQQTTILNLSGLRELTNGVKSSMISANKDTKDKGQIRQNFLRRADFWRNSAYHVLFIAFYLQDARINHKGINVNALIGDTTDGQIRYMVKTLVDKRLEVLFPFTFMKENGQSESFPFAETIQGLQAMETLLDIRQKVEAHEIEVPEDADEIFGKVETAMSHLVPGIALLGATISESEYNLRLKFSELQIWLREKKKDYGLT